jgi:hypothetical protein
MYAHPSKLFALCAALAVAGCTHQEKTPDQKVVSVSAPVPHDEGKPMAPVAVAGEIGPTSAQLQLTFEAPGEQVTFSVAGLDGLKVAPVNAVIGERSFKAGDRAQLAADLNGTGTLVVRISGTFNGARQDRVVSFNVGPVKLDQSGTHVTPDNGEGMKARPSGN